MKMVYPFLVTAILEVITHNQSMIGFYINEK